MAQASELRSITNVSAMQLAEAMFGTGIPDRQRAYTGDPASAVSIPRATPSRRGHPADAGSSCRPAGGGLHELVRRRERPVLDHNRYRRSRRRRGLNEDAGAPTLTGRSSRPTSSGRIDADHADHLLVRGVIGIRRIGFNDAVGVWVNGLKALLTVGDGTSRSTTSTRRRNGNLYVDNANDIYNTEMDGFTVTLTLKARVTPGQVNTIKIGIADAATRPGTATS